MTTTTVHGVTVSLISSDEISQAWGRIEADWPRGRFLELQRIVKDTLHDCSVLADHYEDAARVRAFAAGAAAVRSGVGDLFKDMHGGDLAERARKAGLGS